LSGSPFALLSDEEANDQMDRFVSLLNTFEKGVVVATTEWFTFEGRRFTRRGFWVNVDSDTPPPQFPSVREDYKRPTIISEHPDHVVLEDGSLARCMLFTRFPDYLRQGFLYEYSQVASETVLVFRALDPADAVSKVDKLKMSYEGLASDRRASSSIIQKYNKVSQLALSIGSVNKLFETYTYIICRGLNTKYLDEVEAAVRKHARGRLISVSTPKFFQAYLYNLMPGEGEAGGFAKLRPKYVPSMSVRTWYPFIAEDLIDEGGVFLGYTSTRSPIFFNPFRRNNYNVVILGETGAGKSMTAKVLIKRLKEKNPELRVFGLDPENEYVGVARAFGAGALNIAHNMKLGLDPFKLYHEGLLSVDELSDMLSAFYLPEGDMVLANRLRTEVFDNEDSPDVATFVGRLESLDPPVHGHLSAAVVPPDSNIYSGSPPDVMGNVVFGVRDVAGSVGVAGKRFKALAVTLLAVYLQKQLFGTTASGNYERGLFFVDEAWQFVRYPVTMEVLEAVARKARKYNKSFIFITQRPFDVAKDEAGRAILEQSATSILLRQQAAALDTLTTLYGLRKEEAQALLTAERGNGVMRSGSYLIGISVQPTEEELKLFSTSGSWATKKEAAADA